MGECPLSKHSFLQYITTQAAQSLRLMTTPHPFPEALQSALFTTQELAGANDLFGY